MLTKLAEKNILFLAKVKTCDSTATCSQMEI